MNRMVKRAAAFALLPLGLFLTQASLEAASLVVTNSCSVGPGNGDGVSVTNTTGPCNVNVAVPNGGYPSNSPSTAYANANTTAAWNVLTGDTGPVTLTITLAGPIRASVEIIPTQPYYQVYEYNASATTTFSFNAVLDSSGPIRPGFLTVTSTGAANTYSIGAPYSFGADSVGMNVPGSPYPLNWYSSGDMGPNQSFPPSALPLPVTLGEPFSVTASGMFTANQNVIEGGATGIYAPPLTLQFEFFEADGSTPVMVTDITPEPGTWGFVALGLGFCLLRWRSVHLRLSRW